MNKQTQQAGVNLVVALPCEARPLIHFFRLKPQRLLGGMRVYGNDRGLTLLVSGVGKLATASACGLLAGLQRQETASRSAWLNLGVAGHQCLPVGTGVLISKVIDRATGRVGYPPLVLEQACPTSTLITVEEPETEYADEAAYDMEGSAFQVVAARFADLELVQLFKVISDNASVPVSQVTESAICAWVEDQLPVVDRLVKNLAELVAELSSIHGLPDEFYEVAEMTRLTASQRLQLEAQCRRFYALGGRDLLGRVRRTPVLNGRQLLQQIAELIPPL